MTDNKTPFLYKHLFDRVVFAVIIIVTIIVAVKQQDRLFSITNTQEIGKAYSQSQYVMGDNAINMIDDDTLYQYAAQAYLNGDDPTTVNFEHPPLGKYYYVLSLLAANRIHVLNIILFAVCLFLFAILLKYFQLPVFYSAASILYLALFSSLDYHVGSVLLDLPTLFWSLLFFVILFNTIENNLKYIGLGFALGGLISTKYFFPILFLYTLILVVWAYKKKTLFKLWMTGLMTGLVYISSYVLFFTHGHSLVDFLKFEWFRFRWWTGDRTIPKFIILQTLFTGQFQAWWDTNTKFMKDNSWNISWPILFIAHVASVIKFKFKLDVIVIWLYGLGLFAIYLFGSAVYGRYLLQLIPFWLLTVGIALYGQKNNSKT